MGDWLLHPDDLVAMASLLERGLKPAGCDQRRGQRPLQAQGRHDGTSWKERSGTCSDDPKVKGLVINYRDITEQPDSREEAVKESEEKFRALFDSASDAIFIHDLTGHLPRGQ